MLRFSNTCSIKYHAQRPRRAKGSNGPVADNLLAEQPLAEQSGQQWAGDLTFLKTAECEFYLAAILDLYSRKVIGWAFSRSHDTDRVKGALDMSIALEDKQHSIKGGKVRLSWLSEQYWEIQGNYLVRQVKNKKWCKNPSFIYIYS